MYYNWYLLFIYCTFNPKTDTRVYIVRKSCIKCIPFIIFSDTTLNGTNNKVWLNVQRPLNIGY